MKILLVGCGRMGGAMLKGWISKGIKPEGIVVIEPVDFLAEEIHSKHGVRTYTSHKNIADDFAPDIIIFAIKPQMMQDIAPSYEKFAEENTLFASIAAGKTLSALEKYVGADKSIVRIMPNLPATIAKGTIAIAPNKHVTGEHKRLCNELLEANGSVFWIADESQMDAVTAISGSGPAYIFYFIETLIEAGQKLGLPLETAESLAYTMVQGSADLAALSDISATELRKQVTSPNGTTQAALDVFMAPDGLQPLVNEATKAAYDKSKELAD